jgi:transposase
MFIERIPNRNSPPAILIRESYREGQKVKKRTLANLSKLPAPLIEAIDALLKGARIEQSIEETFEIQRAWPHGHVAAVLGMLRKTGLDQLIESRAVEGRRSAAIIRAMIVSRVIAPGSKLAFWRALKPETATSSLGSTLGLEDVAEREVYAALDWLLEQQPRIEATLAKNHLHDGSLVLYDVSSSYLEGRCCELAQYGKTRDHRSDRLQIVYGLMCAVDGTPVAVEVFEGNTGDPKTLSAQIDKLKRRFKLKRVVLVGDRGMITSARIEEELKPAGLDWITSLRAPQIKALVAEGPLQLSIFDERDLAEITAPDYPGERLIVCRNAELAEERKRKRAELLEMTERNLRRIAQTVRRAPTKHNAATIGRKIGEVINKHKMAKHFTLDIRDGHFSFARNEAAIAAEAQLDGFYVVRTSVPKREIGAEATVAAYKSLSVVERAFRTMKGVDLQVRPIHHWLAERVKAHVLLCMLAYYVEFHMRRALAPMLFADHEPEGRERASIVAAAEPSTAAVQKRRSRKTSDGLAVMDWSDLIAHLATLTLNEVALPLQSTETFKLLARPTPLQEKAFALLGLPLPRVQ